MISLCLFITSSYCGTFLRIPKFLASTFSCEEEEKKAAEAHQVLLDKQSKAPMPSPISLALKREQVAVPTQAGVSENGEKPKRKPIVKKNKVGRNDPCPCGSGKKYKKCCGRDE